MGDKSKILGQVYTPTWIVDEILDEMGYIGKGILKKNILEPSCGDGAFLCEIVKRYIFEAQHQHLSTEQIIIDLETFIYGVELDPVSLSELSTKLKCYYFITTWCSKRSAMEDF